MATLGEVHDPLLGTEMAGVISAVGSEVTEFKVGDVGKYLPYAAQA